MVKLETEYVREILDDLDDIHSIRFRSPKTSVSWRKVERSIIHPFESFLYIERDKLTTEKLKKNFPEHSKAIESQKECVKLKEEDIEEILNVLTNIVIDKGLHKTRVVDGDDVYDMIKIIENKTGVSKDDYKYYPQKE